MKSAMTILAPGKAKLTGTVLVASSVLVGMLLGACGPTSATSTPAAGAGSGDMAGRGQVVYMRYCNTCHPGGGPGAGPAITGEIAEASDQRLADAVRNGRKRMPPFGPSVISDSSLTDLIAYMRTLDGR